MAGDEATDTLAGRLLAVYQDHYAREGRAAAPWQYPDPASAAWRAEYDAAMARRDWQTAAQMLDERAARECPAEATTTQGDGRAVGDVG